MFLWISTLASSKQCLNSRLIPTLIKFIRSKTKDGKEMPMIDFPTSELKKAIALIPLSYFG